MAEDHQTPDFTLQATQGNPIPDGATVGHLTTTDNVNLRYAYWKTTSADCKGTVLVLHGRSEYIEKYFETVNDMRERGFNVLTFDWRGQGGSDRLLRDRRKGHIENFSQYLNDLEAILTEVALPDLKPPHYIIGHSTGSLVALMAAPALANRISRMVLVSPLLALNNLPVRQIILQRVFGLFTFLGQGRRYAVKTRKLGDGPVFEGNKLTSDKNRFERNREILATNPDLRLGPPTIAWVFAACRAMGLVNSAGYSNAISLPCLLVAAGNDRVVSSPAVEEFANRMRAGGFVTVSGSRHELIQERDEYRAKFLAAFDAFIPGET